MKHIKYNLAIILSFLLIALPFVCVVGGLYLYYQYRQEWILLVGAVVTAASLFGLQGARELRVRTRRDVEYDEFGLSKSKGHYEYLSKAERDQMDLQKTADMERLLNTTAIKKMTKHGPKDPVKELNDMIGLEPVKDSVMEMVARMQFETEERKRNKSKKKKDKTAGISARHMVFYGPPGSGKTTVARIMTSFLHQYGYIKENKCIEVDGNFLKAGTESALKTELIVRQAYGGVLFVDEAYALMESGDGSGDQAIATLIKQMEDNRDKFILILAGYTNEMKALLDMNPGFESRIKDYLNFPDYNDDEMREIFAFMAKKENFSIDDSAWPLYNEMVRKERRSSSFGNARTVRNILDKVIDKHSLNVAMKKHPPENRYILSDIDFKNIKMGTIGYATEFDEMNSYSSSITSGGSSNGVIDKNEIAAHTHEGVRDYNAALENIIGMENVKKQIEQMQARMIYEKEVGGLGTSMNGNHMCFYGPAGTGKTTIARIMTGILFDAGYIKDNKCIEISGQFLKGQYIGHAGKRTEAIVAAAMGGVLFIDEAYLLNDNSKNGYGSEAVGVLIKAMEDYKSQFVVVLAGYKDDMEALLESNEGFKSRIKNKLYFDNYDIDTLMQIFFKMLGDKYQITKDAAWKVMKVLSAESKKPGFGNGREVRNLIDKIMDLHAYNYQKGIVDINNPRLLVVEDIPDRLY